LWRITPRGRRDLDLDVEGRPLTKTAQVRMVGNAVPPLLAAAMAGAQFAPSPASSRAA
jgi:DNA (cytosine-5)-methyltransferase 1